MTANVKVLVAENHEVMRVPNMALRFQPPGDLIDSTKIKAERLDRANSGRRSPADSAAKPDSLKAEDRPPRERHSRGDDSSPAKREYPERFGTRLDSVPAALSSSQMPHPRESEKYGVTQTFPEYQKSAYVPARESGMGKVWILNSKGKLEPVYLKTGLSDGKYTEIFSPTLKTGDKIVVGASSNGEAGADQARSPFTGQSSGQRPMGGRF